MAENKELKTMDRTLEQHVGAGGSAHLPATSQTPGFETPEQVQDLEMTTGKRVYLPHGTDVLKLRQGRYEIANALNNPINPNDTSFIEYDISVASGGGKGRQIKAQVSVSGDIYYRNIHTAGTPESGTGGWRKQAYLTPVWSGNVNSGTITFAQPLLPYRTGIEVFYNTISNQRGSVRVLRSLGGAITVPNHPNDTSDKTFQSYELGFTFDKNKLNIDYNDMEILSASGLNRNNTKGISITDVFVI
ncbi:hypothetical protein [Pediococcus pentosaceus]|uniref:hypothetical protein n=1 Tax=Pediococcus pentosaceus TaxID=1255 RepID=UPI000D01149C|nr:hypothetical protein [Pediococcus pentosaceus]AVL01285.1 hypothetical protein PP40703_00050 [Pediococcus pentosaceus]AVL02876.1 hypothetical protein PP40703_08755 [Pediococcus pentosaceus]MBF7133666.1 hypothetical protein [Pediococcus pentosaceus]QPT37001.1 hypothetical protein I6G30_03605 [Pediococcus pentosaceus]RXI22514.1 hypothetical protein EPT61_02250 [Pediococcus pentosaceus]